MKLVKEVNTFTINQDIKRGEFYSFEDTLSCDKFTTKCEKPTPSGVGWIAHFK